MVSVCTDGLVWDDAGYRGCLPQSRLQRFIVHQVRSSTRYAVAGHQESRCGSEEDHGAVTLEEEKNLQTRLA